jgi:hypothetical protein
MRAGIIVVSLVTATTSTRDRISHGVGVGGYNGWVDAFTIGKDINGTTGQSVNSTITYDFEKP